MGKQSTIPYWFGWLSDYAWDQGNDAKEIDNVNSRSLLSWNRCQWFNRWHRGLGFTWRNYRSGRAHGWVECVVFFCHQPISQRDRLFVFTVSVFDQFNHSTNPDCNIWTCSQREQRQTVLEWVADRRWKVNSIFSIRFNFRVRMVEWGVRRSDRWRCQWFVIWSWILCKLRTQRNAGDGFSSHRRNDNWDRLHDGWCWWVK